MIRRSKILSISSIFVGSIITISLLASCGGGKTDKGSSVTYHAGTGYTINGKENFTATNVKVVNAEPAPDPSVGRKFIGWYTTNDYSTPKVEFPLTVTTNTDLYAKWVYDYKEAFTVKFNSNGGSLVSDNKVEKNKYVESSPYTTKNGYTFMGWYKSLVDEYPVTFPYQVSSNIELIAKWKQNSYQPLLHADGLDEIPEGTEKLSDSIYRIKDNIKILKTSPNVSRQDYNFLGWYDRNDESGQLIDFPLTLNSDNLNLYAKFENSGYTVTLKDGTTTKKIDKCTYIPYSPAQIVSAPEGKAFDGWTLDSGTQVTFPAKIDTDVTFNAKWIDKKTCTITYKDDNDQEIDTKTYFKGDIINDPLMPDEKRYYTFEGWYSDKGLWKKPISYPFVVDNDYTFYAKYNRSSFALEFLNIEDDTVIAKKDDNKGIDLSSEKICPAGRDGDYEIDKFTFIDKVTAVSYLDLTNVEGHFKDDGVTVQVYCIWKNNRRYRVNIDYGGLRTAEYFYPTGASYQVGESLNKYKYTSDEQSVVAWTNKDGTHTYNDTDVIDNNKERTFYAKWQNNYRDLKMITYDNPTEQDKPKTVVLTRVKSTCNLSEVQHREDAYRRYELAGYYKSENGETFLEDPILFKTGGTPNKLDDTWKAAKEYWVLKFTDLDVDYGDGTTGFVNHVPAGVNIKLKNYVIKDRTDFNITGYKVNGVSKTPDEDIVLEEGIVKIEVVWEQIAYTVTYNYNYPGAPEPFNKTGCEYFDNTVLPPKREDSFGFDKWCHDPEGKNPFTDEEIAQKLTVNTTAYAKWSNTGYTVTFNVGKTQLAAKFSDGSRIKSFEAVGTLTEADFPICSCVGNMFDGWYTSEIGGTKITTITADSVHNVYAHWTPHGGYVSLCLKTENDGYFEETNTDAVLFSVPKDSYFYEFKDSLPIAKYPEGNFTLNYYSYTSGGDEIDQSDKFSEPKFLYAVDKDNPQTPTGSFETDSWATIINVAENRLVDERGWTKYTSSMEALKAEYPGLKIGLTKDMVINGRPYKARIVGIGQDYGDETRYTRLPLTFDFTDSVFVSGYGSAQNFEQSCWSKNYLHSRLNTDGDFYNAMPSYLTRFNHIATTYKWSKELYKKSDGTIAVTSAENAVVSENKMFVPDGYEINAYGTKLTNYDFVYQLYEGQLKNPFSDIIRKKYLNLDYCCYHTRGHVTTSYTNYYIKITADSSSGILKWTYGPAATVAAGRAICPFFCLGTPYIPE